MLPSLGFAEILVIALLAIIVVGPKDLPRMMRAVGGFLRKIRMMGNEFKQAFEDMDQDGELAELRKELSEIKKMGNLDDLSDRAFNDEMRRLDEDLRSGVSGVHPRTNAPDTKADKPSKPSSDSAESGDG